MGIWAVRPSTSSPSSCRRPEHAGLGAAPHGHQPRAHVEILRAALLKGAGLVDLWQRLLALLAFGVGILALASLRFGKRLA